MNSSLGIYFGPKIISIVETKGKKVLNTIKINRALISSGGLEEKVPEEIKIVAIIKDELRKKKIEAKEVMLTLSGKDLVVRTFEMPIIPREELEVNAVHFESRKYIPFKIEDLISDFQLKLDKSTRRNSVLFVGIKKDILENYLSILNQLNLKVKTVECSAFSIIRMLELAHIGKKGVIGFLNVDFQEEDEVNFTVLENGFSLFSRDITLSLGRDEPIEGESADSNVLFEKVKTELRISLDFYHRKFPTKSIEKIIFVTNKEYKAQLEAFIKDVGVNVQFLDISKYLGKEKNIVYNSSFLKGYSISLFKAIKSYLKINLLVVRAKLQLPKDLSVRSQLTFLLEGLKIDYWMVTAGVFLCLAAYFFGFYQKMPLNKKYSELLDLRPKVSVVNSEATYDELIGINDAFKDDFEVAKGIIFSPFFLTDILNAIPESIPGGMWLTDFTFHMEKDNNLMLQLNGIIYLDDADKELESVNTFVVNLDENKEFNKYFDEVNILSVERGTFEQTAATIFTISCEKRKK